MADSVAAATATATVAVLGVMRGALERRQRLAEGRRPAYGLRGCPRPDGRDGDADLRALHSRDTEEQAHCYRALRAAAPVRLRSSLMSWVVSTSSEQSSAWLTCCTRVIAVCRPERLPPAASRRIHAR